jgi:hypothetical protein
MPTATGLPKAGDQVYNDYFKQRFRVMSRSSNSFPLTIYIRPMPGKDFPDTMLKGQRRMPNGTYPLLLEAPMDDMFRMGVSHWTNLPDQGEIEPGRIVQCDRHDIHGPHLYLRNRVWHKCRGIKSAEKPPPREGKLDPADSGRSLAGWNRVIEQSAAQARGELPAGTTPVERRITAFLEDTEETDPAIRLAQAEELLRQARSALRRARRS